MCLLAFRFRIGPNITRATEAEGVDAGRANGGRNVEGFDAFDAGREGEDGMLRCPEGVRCLRVFRARDFSVPGPGRPGTAARIR